MSFPSDTPCWPAGLIPHAPPMVFLDELIERAPGRIRCAARAPAGVATDICLGIEMMAQAAAALGGLDRGGPARQGALIAVREANFAVDELRASQLLHSEAALSEHSGDLQIFECALRDAASGALLANARLTVRLGEILEGQ